LWLLAASFASEVCAQDAAASSGSNQALPGMAAVPEPAAGARGVAQDYRASVASGLQKAVMRDFEGALGSLREAALREPAHADAFCALGDVQLAKGDLTEARAAFQTCSRFALASGDARMIALGLVGEARVFEREGNKREEREAWKRTETAAVLENAKALAVARIAVLDAALALEADYEGVRTRIAQRKARSEKKLP
jgi:ATP/maltotriose-dependent transcriptional regulator MalT